MRFNKYNNKTYQLATAFMVSLGIVLEERKDELVGRMIVPIGGAQAGIGIGDKHVTYKATNTRRVAEVVVERNDDISFTDTEAEDRFAKLHWIRSGFKQSIEEKDNILSHEKDIQTQLFNLKANETFYAISEKENDEILYGNDKLQRAGLLTVSGKRVYDGTAGGTIDLSTATGEQVIDMIVAAQLEFTNSKNVKGKYNARTLVIDNTLYAKLLKSYGTQEYKTRLSIIQELGLFNNIVSVKGLVNPTTKKPTALILDNVPENFQAIVVQEATAAEWEIGRTTYVAVEEKISEIVAFRPEAIMELTLKAS